MDPHRTGGMTAIAVLSIIFGGVGILSGLFQLVGAFAMLHELWRLGVYEIPAPRFAFAFVLLATGVIGLVAGIGIFKLRPWARALSFVYAALLIASAALSYKMVPIIATIGTYDIGSVSADGLVRLIIFSLIYVVIPVPYALLLCLVLSKPAWKAAFANSRTA